MTTIYRFPDGVATEASCAEEATERLNENLDWDYEDEPNQKPQYYVKEDAHPVEIEDFSDFEKAFEAKLQKDTVSEHDIMLETFGEDYEKVRSTNPQYIWTVLDGDDGLMYLVAGHHLVNRIGYVISQKPWVSGDETFLW